MSVARVSFYLSSLGAMVSGGMIGAALATNDAFYIFVGIPLLCVCTPSVYISAVFSETEE